MPQWNKLMFVPAAALLLGACSNDGRTSDPEAGLPDSRSPTDVIARDGVAGDLRDDTRPGDDELNVEESLPDSVWTGALRYVDSDGSDSVADWRLVIDGNAIVGEVHGDGQFGITRESLVYREPGVADWLDGKGQVVGRCAASGGSLTCSYAEGQPAQEVSTRTFRQRSLVWSRKGQHEQLTYEETGTLTRAE